MAWPRPQRSGGGLKYPLGEYRDAVQILAEPPVAQRTRDEYNVEQPDPRPFAARYARIEPLSGREFLAGEQALSGVTHRINLRFVPGLTAAMQVQLGARTFGIEAVLDLDNVHYEHELMCVENTTTAPADA